MTQQQEGFCDIHGPYDSSLGSCPYCARQSSGRPQQPAPLWEGEEPTDPWGGRGGPDDDDDLAMTDPKAGRGGYGDELDETEIPSRFQRKGDDWAEGDDLDKTVIDRPAKIGLLGWLIIKEGPRRGHIEEIRNGTTIGRKEGQVIINDPKMSRRHAKFRIRDDQFEIGDLVSENGTFVNGEEIESITPLQENDEIKMGDTIFVLKTLA